MRVGVYVDGFNLYYGGKNLDREAGYPGGWKWLDIHGLATSLLVHDHWDSAKVTRVVYCSAPRSSTGDGGSSRDQTAYLSALRAHAEQIGYDLEVTMGRFTRTSKRGILNRGRLGMEVTWSEVMSAEPLPTWLRLTERSTPQGPQALGSFTIFEEKGSDVNVATHLTLDVLTGAVDAAMVISNDSDLELPIRLARQHVPVAVVNPTTRYTAGALRGSPHEGVGNHFWVRLEHAQLAAAQLPDPMGENKPSDW